MTPVKYAHPHRPGLTWTGRGKKPAWVQEWLDAGNTLEELVPAPTPASKEEGEPAVVQVLHLPPEHLHPSPTNPRKSFPADKLQELADSIRAHGILQPILARPGPEQGQPWPYEIIAGERRWRAAVLAEQASVPVLVRYLSDQETVEFQVVENLQREDLHPLEEAEGYALMVRDYSYSADDLAAKIGKSRAYVYARLKLTALCEAGQQAYREGKLSASTALLVARIPGAELQAKYLDHITGGWQGPLSYREALRVAQYQYMLRLAEAGFDTTLADLIADTPACTACPKRSGNQPELFADVASADVCTDPGCFGEKREAWAVFKRAEAEAMGRKIITGPAAADIIPPWATNPMARSESGYVALDELCHRAPPRQIDEPAPTEPNDDADEATIEAYQQAADAYEARTTPTYRDILAGAGGVVETVLVQHPRTGEMVECVQAQAAAPILAAQGVTVSTGRTLGDSDREREKVAREQTAYRTHLVNCILFAAREDALDLSELRLVAGSAYEQRDFDTQKLIVRIWRESDAKIERVDTDDLADEIQHMDAPDVNNLLRLITLAGRVRVASYSSDPTTTPPTLVAMADRWGIDLEAVKRQAAEAAKTKKKGK